VTYKSKNPSGCSCRQTPFCGATASCLSAGKCEGGGVGCCIGGMFIVVVGFGVRGLGLGDMGRSWGIGEEGRGLVGCEVEE